MSERIPDSSGLPLRAMVMVLLFLGVVFLLIALQAVVSGDDDDTTTAATTTSPTATATAPAAEPEPEPAPRPPVRVYNVSDVTGAADAVSATLVSQQWDAVPENLSVAEVPEVTTVYWGPEPGEQQAAEEVGAILAAPVVERLPELADQPPGVIVLVTG